MVNDLHSVTYFVMNDAINYNCFHARKMIHPTLLIQFCFITISFKDRH